MLSKRGYDSPDGKAATFTMEEETNNSVEAEDAALARAVAEGIGTGRVSEQDVIDVLERKPLVTVIDEHNCMGPSEGRGG